MKTMNVKRRCHEDDRYYDCMPSATAASSASSSSSLSSSSSSASSSAASSTHDGHAVTNPVIETTMTYSCSLSRVVGKDNSSHRKKQQPSAQYPKMKEQQQYQQRDQKRQPRKYDIPSSSWNYPSKRLTTTPKIYRMPRDSIIITTAEKGYSNRNISNFSGTKNVPIVSSSSSTLSLWNRLIAMLLVLFVGDYDIRRSLFVMAYPNGTGSCVGGMPATSFSQHANPLLHPIIIEQDMQYFNIQVILEEYKNSKSNKTATTRKSNSYVIEPNGDPFSSDDNISSTNIFYVAKEYRISVVATEELPFMGVFVRIAPGYNENTTIVLDSATLMEEENLQSADYICQANDNVVGLTHYNNSNKTIATGILYMQDLGDIHLDVTVVLSTVNGSISSIGYNNYTLSFIESNQTDITYVPTVAPIISAAPTGPQSTAMPTASPIIASTFRPTATAITPTTSAPSTSTPSTSPSASPISSIVNSTAAPTMGHGVSTSVPTISATDSNQTKAPVSAPPPTNGSVIDTDYTQSIMETYDNLLLTLDNVPTLTLSDLRNVEVVLSGWFQFFYNNRSSQMIEGANNTQNTPSTNNSSSTNNTSNRQLLSLLYHGRNMQDDVAPQLYVVQGTMQTKVSIINQSITTSSGGMPSNTLRYSQQIIYRLFNDDSPSLPLSMKGSNYHPLSPFQYMFLPYRSTSGNADAVTMLQSNLPSAFSNIVSPIQVPQYVGYSSTTDNSTNSDNSSLIFGLSTTIVAVIAAVAGLILLIAIYGIFVRGSSRRKSSNHNKKRSSIDSSGNSNNNNDNTKSNYNTSTNNAPNNNNNYNPPASPVSDEAALINPFAQFRKKSIPPEQQQQQLANTTTAAIVAESTSRPPPPAPIASSAPATTSTTQQEPEGVFAKFRRNSLNFAFGSGTNKEKSPKQLTLADEDPSSYDGESQYTTNNNSTDFSYQQQAYRSTQMKNSKKQESDSYMLDYSYDSPQKGASSMSSPDDGDVAAGGNGLQSSYQRRSVQQNNNNNNKNNDNNTIANQSHTSGTGGGGNSTVISEVEPSSVVSGYSKYTYATGASEEYVVYAPSGKLGIVVDNPEDESGPIIYAIKETSPLLDSQLNVGDRLVMVDEIDVTKMPPALISKLISKRAQNPMRKLTLQRSVDAPAERLAV